jgi:hypothetical protein
VVNFSYQWQLLVEVIVCDTTVENFCFNLKMSHSIINYMFLFNCQDMKDGL